MTTTPSTDTTTPSDAPLPTLDSQTAECNNYSTQIMLEYLDDVLTMNSSPNRNYQYFGTSIASRYRIRSGIMMRYGYGNVSTRHRTSADILFIKDGKPQIIFSNIR